MQGCSILVVDDDEAVRLVAVEMLKTLGCDVHGASSGKEALSILGAVSYDLVLLDVGMPIMGGKEVCRRVRADLPHQKIVFITGYAEEDLGELLDDNTWILGKPFSIDSLSSTVQRGCS